MTQIPVTVNLFDKASKFEYNAVPNQYYPVLEFGDRYNQTQVDLNKLDVGFLDLGSASDGDQTGVDKD